VVFNNDKDILINNLRELPCLELKNRIDRKAIERYFILQQSGQWIPCQDNFHQVEQIYIDQSLNRMLVERLERKTLEIEELLSLNKNNWQNAFYQAMARNF